MTLIKKIHIGLNIIYIAAHASDMHGQQVGWGLVVNVRMVRQELYQSSDTQK
jgi:hypothetical protein